MEIGKFIFMLKVNMSMNMEDFLKLLFVSYNTFDLKNTASLPPK